MADHDCIFCQIINKKIPAKINYEDDNFIAINDIKPQSPVHILLISKHHYPSLEKVDKPELITKILPIAKKVAKKAKINANYKLMINVGPKLQDIMHLHLHILGGW